MQHAGICYAYELPTRRVDKLIALSLNCCACACRVIINIALYIANFKSEYCQWFIMIASIFISALPSTHIEDVQYF